MADDIVNRLRGMASDRARHSTHYDGCVWVHPLCGLSWALDEVELLRSVLSTLAAQDDLLDELIYPNETWLAAYSAAVSMGKEARRG